MVIIDSDVLLLAFAFQNDKHQAINKAFLDNVQFTSPATTIYNVMEVLGQLSFNLSASRLEKWHSWLIDAYQLTIIWPVEPDEPISISTFRDELYEHPFQKMREHRMAFMDAMVLSLADRTEGAKYLVTWNAKHFKGKTSLPVLTPEEYLAH